MSESKSRTCVEPGCGNPIKPTGRKYCSRACANKTRTAATRAKMSRAKKGKPLGPRTPQIDRTCEQCGRAFTVPRWKARQHPTRFCSVPCKNAWQKTQPMDPEVRAIFLAYSRNQPPHSEESRRKRAEAIRGPKHHRWRGGITSENRRLRASMEYRQWRSAVYERDGYACQECGDDTSGNLRAHHIKSFAEHPDLRFEVSNGLTLCQPCHEQTDTYGSPRRTICATSSQERQAS